MTAFRLTALTAFAMLSLPVLTGCPQRHSAHPPSAHVHEEFSGQFQTIATAEFLGTVWQDSGSRYVREIWSDATGGRALILLRGETQPALWLDLDRSQLATELELQHRPLYVDAGNARVFGLDAVGALQQRELPAGDWRTSYEPPPGTQILALAGHEKSPEPWLLLAEQTVPEHDLTEPPAATSLDDPVTDTALQPTPRKLLALRLSKEPAQPTELLATDAEAPLQLAALSDGAAVAAVGGTLYLLRNGQPAREVYAAERELKICADIAEPVVWVHVLPRTASSGTGRDTRAALPGAVLALRSDGSELGRMNIGEAALGRLAGDWLNRRALLGSNRGVLALDFATDRAFWPLRHTGVAPLHLVGQGRQLWALLPDGICGISTTDLVEIAPQLEARQVLNREQTAALKPAVDAVGWDWAAVQVSPLSDGTGKLTLFNTTDTDAEVAELEWSAQQKRVCRLLIVRRPTSADANLAEEASARKLLQALGWSDTVRAELLRSEDGADYEQLWLLNDGSAASGEFRAWYSAESVLLSLDEPRNEPASASGATPLVLTDAPQ